MTTAISIDFKGLCELVPHRHPFLMLDGVSELVKGDSIHAFKHITPEEPYFPGHFPGNPIVPGVMIVEMMAQAGVVLYTLSVDESEEDRRKTKFLAKADVRFLAPAFPGDKLEAHLSVVKIIPGTIVVKGRVVANQKVLAKGELYLMQAQTGPFAKTGA